LKRDDEAGLVEDCEGQPALEDELKIKPCSPDSESQNDEDFDWTPAKPAS
jgi:hypothetical protein